MEHPWERFHAAFGGGEHRVMGRDLRPFSLYHQFWLEAIASPLLHPDHPSTPADLEIAARVCACGYGEVPRALQRRAWGAFHALHALWFGLRWRVSGRGGAFQREMARFAAYVTDHTAQPDMHRDEAPKRAKGAPAPARETPAHGGEFPSTLALVTALVRGGLHGGDEAMCWMTPVGRAVWYGIAFARAAGVDVKLKTPLDVEFERGIREDRERGKLEPINPDELVWTAGPPGLQPAPGWDPHG